MARTPLFVLIERCLRAAQASSLTHVPLGEILDGAAERGVSRRTFLATTAAATAFTSCRTFVPPAKEPEVIVIGAGIAGLTAGYRLARAGVGVRIFDAQYRTGGRMFSLRNFFPDGQVAELGGELIDSSHTHIRHLARELAIEIDDLAGDDRALRGDVWYFDGARRSERDVAQAFLPIAERIKADVARLGSDEILAGSGGVAAALDRMTLAQWLDEAGVSGWFRELLDVGFTTEYGLEIDRQSSLNLLTMIDPVVRPFRIYGESDERFHIRGGNDRVPGTLTKLLIDHIELGAALQHMRTRSDGQIECTFTRGATTFRAAAPHVIVTIPFTTLRDVEIEIDLPERKWRAIRELGYGTNAKLMIGFEKRVWRTHHRSNGSTLTDLGYQLSWETSRLQPGASGILTNFTGGQRGLDLGQGTAEERAIEVAKQMETVFPGIEGQRGKQSRMHWPTHPWVRASYACYLPGQWTTIRGAEGEAVGNLHFAGEHCSLDAQGFMEGGCETGERAAAEVIAALQPRAAITRLWPGLHPSHRRAAV